MNFRSRLPLLTLIVAIAAAPAGEAQRYANDFSKAAPGKPSDDEFLILSGTFEVKDVAGEKLLELAPVPIDGYGVLFGPAEHATGAVSARVWGATTGRRYPEFGIGSNDAGGYKLWLMPRRGTVAIRKSDDTVATAPYVSWKSETWTRFRLSVSKTAGGAWKVQGRVWPDGADEPAEWTVSFEDAAEPPAGRASMWGHPYSGQPIRFDDLSVTPSKH